MNESLNKIKNSSSAFDDAETPYLSLAFSQHSTRYGEYDHLARVKEWGVHFKSEGGSND